MWWAGIEESNGIRERWVINAKQRGVAKTNHHLNIHIEIQRNGSFYNYINRYKKSKLSHQVMEQTKHQLDIYCHQMKPPMSRMDYI